MATKTATVGYLITPRLLGVCEKKKKIGAGRIMGFGGKHLSKESDVECIIRETKEELGGVRVLRQGLEEVARIDFYNVEGASDPAFRCAIFFASKWQGEPKETNEVRFLWIPLRDIPQWLDKMPAGDRLWLPRVLAGERLNGFIRYRDTSLTEVVSSSFGPLAVEMIEARETS
jgi:8-oxo-dGTP diphosphatase